MKRIVLPCCALALAGCIGVKPPSQMASYAPATLAPQADAEGWYTFGTTRFKGSLANGAPDGIGQCIETGAYSRRVAAPCTFARGARMDAEYLEEKKDEIAAKQRREIQDQQEQAAWAAQRDREMAQSRKEANAWLSQEIAGTGARMAAQMNRVESASRGSTPEEDAAKIRRRAEFDRVVAEQAADPNSEINQSRRRDQERAAVRKEADDKARRQSELERARVADAKKGAEKGIDPASDEKRNQEKERAAAAQKDADEKARKLAQERERARIEADRLAKEQARKREQERIAAAAAKKAAKEAEERAEREAKANYLQALTQGTKLRARTCPDGKGSHYIVGIRPRIKPEVVSCIDVRYRAMCEGSAVGIEGVAKNFVGAATDCFMGDTAEITPKPACPVAQVRVAVLSISACAF